MAVAKRSISFDPEVLDQVERLRAESGQSLSAFVNEAAEREVKLAGLKRLLDEDEAEFGPVPEDVKAKVAADWPE